MNEADYQHCISANPHGVYVGHAFCGACPTCHYCGLLEQDVCSIKSEDGRQCIKHKDHQDAHLNRRGPFVPVAVGA